jgi:hypothetical protein
LIGWAQWKLPTGLAIILPMIAKAQALSGRGARIRLGVLAVAGLLVTFGAGAATAIHFDGDVYYRHHAKSTESMRVIEYRRRGEGENRWMRRIAVRQFPRLNVSPRRAVIGFERELKLHFPHVHDEILQANQGRDVQIDFTLVAPDRSFIQFGIRHYVHRPGYSGVISYEFAYRLHDLTDGGLSTFSRKRRRWITEMLHVNWPIPFPRETRPPKSGGSK